MGQQMGQVGQSNLRYIESTSSVHLYKRVYIECTSKCITGVHLYKYSLLIFFTKILYTCVNFSKLTPLYYFINQNLILKTELKKTIHLTIKICKHGENGKFQ